MSRDYDKADEIFMAEAILAETPKDGKPFGMVELARYLTSADMQLTSEQTRRLFSDPGLRQGYQAIKEALTHYQMPQLMAASDGDVQERPFPGGSLKLVPSSRSGQLYLRMEFDTDPVAGRIILLVESPTTGVHKLGFTISEAQTSALVPLDLNNDLHSRLVSALRDPASSGSILQPERDPRPV